jgi:hypothetical protein
LVLELAALEHTPYPNHRLSALQQLQVLILLLAVAAVQRVLHRGHRGLLQILTLRMAVPVVDGINLYPLLIMAKELLAKDITAALPEMLTAVVVQAVLGLMELELTMQTQLTGVLLFQAILLALLFIMAVVVALEQTIKQADLKLAVWAGTQQQQRKKVAPVMVVGIL